MATTVEERAAALLEALIEERDTTPADVAATLGLEPAAVDRLLGGREPLELARLERVLAVLGASPAAFFARLYGGAAAPGAEPSPPEPAPAVAPVTPPSPAGAPDEPITRREVEEVLGTLRSMIDGMVRMLDAERAADRTRGPGE